MYHAMKKSNCAVGRNSLICFLIKLSLFISLFFNISSAHSAGELLVAPTRVVFENRDRSTRVNLINTGTETTTYRIEFENKRMTETGQFVNVEKILPGDLFLDNMVRYSPRQVTLPPGQSQAIRIILRKPANLPEGEYRSHLLFRSIPSSSPSNIEDAVDPDSGQISIKLIPVLGISIPVIARHGQLSAEINITEMRYHSGDEAHISLALNRSGKQSVYGDLTATFTDQKGESFVIGKANGVVVYTPNTLRRFKLPVQASPGLQINKGKLQISFHEKAKAGGKLLTESTISIP